jgi:deoxycytidine triphosphate deaminase
MPVLTAIDIRKRIAEGQLVLDAHCDPSGTPTVEAASYDLRAGIVLWKEKESKELRTVHFVPGQPYQEVVTLMPGQMVFVISHEELSLPFDICGTVYSRNRLQKQNILALNAGHVDPGYTGPIIIRLINLSRVEWPLTLGDGVFTAVFHTLGGSSECKKDVRSKSETLSSAQETACQAFSNPLHELYTEELKKHFALHDQQLEATLRRELANEFFRKSDTAVLAFVMIIAIVTILGLLLKVPWHDIANWVSPPPPQ